MYFALLPAVTKRELPGKNKIRAGIQGSFPRMFSNRLQLWNFIGQRLVKFMEEDSKVVRYSSQRYRLSSCKKLCSFMLHFLYKCHVFIKSFRCPWYPLENINRNQFSIVTQPLLYLTSAIFSPPQSGCSLDGAFQHLWSLSSCLMFKFCNMLLR